MAGFVNNPPEDSDNLVNYYLVLETGEFLAEDALDSYISANPGRTYQIVMRETNQGPVVLQTPPEAITQSDLDLSYYTQAEVDQQITNGIDTVVNGAGSATDTLSELATLIATNSDAMTAINAAIANKADIGHAHTIADITGLQTALDSKTDQLTTYTKTEVDNLIAGINAGGDTILCFHWAEKSISRYDWVQIQTVTDSDVSYYMPWTGTIIGISGYCEESDASSNYIPAITLYFEDTSQGDILTFPQNSNPHGRSDISLSIAVPAGTRIRLRGADVQNMKINDVTISLFIRKD